MVSCKKNTPLWADINVGKTAVDTYYQQFSVEFNYPVYFTEDLFHPKKKLLISTIDRLKENRQHRLAVFIDSGVVETTPGIREKIGAHLLSHKRRVVLVGPIELVPGGEQQKNDWDLVKQIMESIAKRHLCRQSYVLTIGGGSVLDIVGLAASLVHRGLRHVRIPTTVLAQNDAGVGVKNGIDGQGMKNFAGTFAPPFAVINDFHFLRTLSDKYWYGGVAEALKVAIIKDADFFKYLYKNRFRLRERNETIIRQVVKHCAMLHLEHIRTGGDPFEFGTARPLDFGHWSAHKIETLSGYEIGHGQAVAIGIAMDSFYAAKEGFITLEERDQILYTIEKIGLPIWSDLLTKKNTAGDYEILGGLDDFQEHLGGNLHITLPKGIGGKVDIHHMKPDNIIEAIAFLKKRARLP